MTEVTQPMTRSNDLQAVYDAADQRVHKARETLKGAILERVKVRQEIAESRVPEDVEAHLERMAEAYALTPEEQAERKVAQERYDALMARRAELIGELAAVVKGNAPERSPEGAFARVGMRMQDVKRAMQTAKQREARNKAAREAIDYELAELEGEDQRPGPLRRARRELNGVIQRTDKARQRRRLSVKEEWAEARRKRPVSRNVQPGTFAEHKIKDGKIQ